MKKHLVGLVGACLLASSYALAEPPKLVLPTTPAPLPTFRVPTVKPPICIDPAAASIDFSISARKSRFSGRIQVLAKVKNVGNAAYVSGDNQQIAQLLEIVPGGRPRVVATVPFGNLAVGAEVPIVFHRHWDASSPAEGEFPPSYRLVITYDPDIAIDGNARNDDCRADNNTLERSGSGVNALFR